MSTVEASATAPRPDVLSTWAARLNSDGIELLKHEGPVWSAAAGERTVIFDGVLHNRAELIQLLANAHDEDDNATLVLKAYERWGRDVLKRIKGIHAVAIWDGATRSAILARDPIGLSPLFYAGCGDDVYFSTSIDRVLACDGVSGALNRGALADHVFDQWLDPGETYFEAVRRVPACHALLVERGAHRVERYWDPAPPGEDIEWIDEDDLEQFRDLFDQAVNRCLALGPTGIFLSGGLDSVSVAGVAADNCRRQGLPDPLALSLVFPHPECNEELTQRAVARGLGLEQVLINLDDAIGENGLLLSACEFQAGKPSPMLNYFTPAYDKLSAVARARGLRAVLTGNGGDEWLTVSPFVAADLIRSRDLRGLARHMRAVRRSFNISWPLIWRNAWRFGAQPLLKTRTAKVLSATAPGVLARYRSGVIERNIPAWVAPDPALAAEVRRRGLEFWGEPAEDGWYRNELRLGLEHRLVSMEWEEYFENTRRTGLRTLSPFLDSDLIDFMYRVPPELLDRGSRSKGLVRAELARRFPDLGFDRHRKVAATAFSREVAMNEAERVWQELGGMTALAELGIVDAKAFERELRNFLSGGQDRDATRMWNILNLEAWTKTRL
jgi:asparagine synthetase B (glutamine-hydrolysing)